MVNEKPDCCVVATALVIDSYEKLVTGDIRMLDQYRRLLVDARHALASGSLDVVDEFIERSVDAMDKRLAALRDR